MQTEGGDAILVYYVKPIRKKSLPAGYNVTLRGCFVNMTITPMFKWDLLT
jgi:hypothetical protein